MHLGTLRDSHYVPWVPTWVHGGPSNNLGAPAGLASTASPPELAQLARRFTSSVGTARLSDTEKVRGTEGGVVLPVAQASWQRRLAREAPKSKPSPKPKPAPVHEVRHALRIYVPPANEKTEDSVQVLLHSRTTLLPRLS